MTHPKYITDIIIISLSYKFKVTWIPKRTFMTSRLMWTFQGHPPSRKLAVGHDEFISNHYMKILAFTTHEFHETCHSVTFYFMKIQIF